MMSMIKRAMIPSAIPTQEVQSYVHGLQHLILFVPHQYECKSYRRFVDFLQEAFGVGEFLGLSRIPHYITIQKQLPDCRTAFC